MSVAKNSDYRRYWNELFPIAWHRCLETLATCNGRFPLSQCELVPRWENGPGGGTVMNRTHRFGSFEDIRTITALPFEQAFRLPSTIQFGSAGGACAPLWIDIDIDDEKSYNRSGICSCGSHQICDVCWTAFIVPARRVMDYIFGTIFGFTKMFDYYTGRRGIRRCICDDRVINWTNEQRTTCIYRCRSFLELEEHSDCIYEILKQTDLPGEGGAAKAGRLDKKMLFDLLYPVFDLPVTADVKHLKNPPLMMNPHTRNICVPLPPVDDAHYCWYPSQARGPNEMSETMMENLALFILNAIK